MSGDPGQDRVEVVKRFGFGSGPPSHDDDLDLQHARRLDLGIGRAPAAVLGHHSFDLLALHKCEFVSERERAARENQLAFRQGVNLRWPVDRPYDVVMLRGSREGGELQPALGEKDRPSLSPESRDGVVHRHDFDPAVTGFARPRGAGEHDKRRAGRATGSDRIGRHARSERMGGVDNGADVLTGEECRQAFGAAEAADALGNWRLRGIGRRPRQRQDGRNIGLVRKPPGKRAGFRRAAENEQTKALQWTAP
jgi:hypothetical protein